MAYIYKITNDINQKIYIGKTEFDIQKRFKEHCKDAYKDSLEKRPLYSAIRKYGPEHFYVELVEETNNPEERETYWIEYYGSFKNGYNATMGGDGKRYIDYDLIYESYINSNKLIYEIAEDFGISKDSVRHILEIKGCSKEYRKQKQFQCLRKAINCFDKEENYIKTYSSVSEAVRDLINNGIIKCKDYRQTRGSGSHITDVCKGKRKTAYGFIWKFANLG